MESLHQSGSFVQSCVEQILHADELLAWELDCDQEFESAAQWSEGFDAWHYGSIIDLDVVAEQALALIAEADLVAKTIAEAEQEEEMDAEELERWFESLEPTLAELEARDLGDAFLGHDA
jgi:hypothetical protein